jgi:hypothetical protein
MLNTPDSARRIVVMSDSGFFNRLPRFVQAQNSCGAARRRSVGIGVLRRSLPGD